MSDTLDRILRVRCLAAGLPDPPKRNIWQLIAAGSALAIAVAFGSGGVAELVGAGGDPTEWAGLTPYLDWDPADATELGSVVTTLPDSSGNGRDAAQALAAGGYPFIDCPMPTLLAADSNFGGFPSLKFFVDYNATSYAPALLFPTMPSGPYTVAVVCYSTLTNPAESAPGVGNYYAVSSQSDNIGIYVNGAADQAFHAWGDPSFAEPAPSVDFATTPTVLILSSSGESSVGANDAVVRFYAKSLTPASTTADKAPIAAVPWILGSYNGGAVYSLQGAIARVIVWDTCLTDGVQTTAALNALGTKYGITIAP